MTIDYVAEATDWRLAEAAIEHCAEVGLHVLLWGPPGNGKSYIAKTTNLPSGGLFVTTLTADTPGAEVRGHFVLGAQSTNGATDWHSVVATAAAKSADPIAAAVGVLAKAISDSASFSWHDGPAVAAWRTGGRFVADELGEAAGDVQTLMHAITDDREHAGMTLPNGEFLRPSDGFQTVATTNVDPGMIPTALADRFIPVHVWNPNPHGILALPTDLQEFAWNAGSTRDADRRISLRKFFQFSRLRAVAGVPMALDLCFGDRSNEVRDALAIGGGTAY